MDVGLDRRGDDCETPTSEIAAAERLMELIRLSNLARATGGSSDESILDLIRERDVQKGLRLVAEEKVSRLENELDCMRHKIKHLWQFIDDDGRAVLGFLLGAAMIGFALIVWLGIARPVSAHEWYSTLVAPGTEIPGTCCNNEDCRPVPICVTPTGDVGLEIDPNGCTSIDPARVVAEPSPDGQAHVCTAQQIGESNLWVRCIVLPSGGYAVAASAS
jgi:hypothetical protein